MPIKMSKFKVKKEQESKNDFFNFTFPLYTDIMSSTMLATQSYPACLEKRQNRGHRIETIQNSVP